ncbi:MAG: flagellar basal body M-ring protein FliF, partial [Sphaerotilus sp.]|nr:flagellar basal body M-ring protein FliF [Sphaerotilus sp.]
DKVEALPLWKQPEVLEMVRTLAVPLVLGLLGLALVFGVIRPVLRDLRRDKETEVTKVANQLNAVVDDVTDLPALSGGDSLQALPAPEVELSESDKRLEAVRQMVRTNPASVARILRGWANGKDAD